MERLKHSIENATSAHHFHPDWESILAICSQIRLKEATFKDVLPGIKTKLHDREPKVQYYALMVVGACMKNCGNSVHEEVASKAFMDEMRQLIMSGAPPMVKNKVLELVQEWKNAFRGQDKFVQCELTFNAMQRKGFKFPDAIDSEATFSPGGPPAWIAHKDRLSCPYCGVVLSPSNGKRRCLNCGDLFCDECTLTTLAIPKYGITTPVHVCECCYGNLGGRRRSPGKDNDSVSSADYQERPNWTWDVVVDNCNLCHTSFGLFTRKHHCHHCGEIFCSKCSSKALAIPKFGYNSPVRVCDRCYGKLGGRDGDAPSGAKSPNGSDLPPQHHRLPDWDRDEDWVGCGVCHTTFGLFTRKHHCRHCGKIFCRKCSSKALAIPKFGYESPVHVCDRCYHKLGGRDKLGGTDNAARSGARSPGEGNGSGVPVVDVQSSGTMESQDALGGPAAQGLEPEPPATGGLRTVVKSSCGIPNGNNQLSACCNLVELTEQIEPFVLEKRVEFARWAVQQIDNEKTGVESNVLTIHLRKHKDGTLRSCDDWTHVLCVLHYLSNQQRGPTIDQVYQQLASLCYNQSMLLLEIFQNEHFYSKPPLPARRR